MNVHVTLLDIYINDAQSKLKTTSQVRSNIQAVAQASKEQGQTRTQNVVDRSIKRQHKETNTRKILPGKEGRNSERRIKCRIRVGTRLRVNLATSAKAIQGVEKTCNPKGLEDSPTSSLGNNQCTWTHETNQPKHRHLKDNISDEFSTGQLPKDTNLGDRM
jgi:hypothetical protein